MGKLQILLRDFKANPQLLIKEMRITGKTALIDCGDCKLIIKVRMKDGANDFNYSCGSNCL